MYVLSYILINMRSVLMTGFGILFMFILLYKMNGIRCSLSLAIAAIFAVWAFRCFILRLYISDYMAGLYLGEKWFFYFFQAVNIFNLLFGVAIIGLIFKGNLAKNLLIEFMVEMVLSMVVYIPMAILDSLLGDNYSKALVGYFNPLDLVLFIPQILLLYLFIRYGEPLIKRYKEWTPKHPVLLNISVTAFLFFGLLSNYTMAATRGGAGFSVFLVLMMIVVLYFWYDYLHIRRMYEKVKREELVSKSNSMKKHYTEVLEQTTRLDQYRQEISTAINNIINRILEAEEPLNKDKKENGKDFLDIASNYLEQVRQQYSGLTVHKYCDDVRMNEYLLACEEQLKSKGVDATFLFREYSTPAGIPFADITAVISWMLKELVNEASTEAKTGESKQEDYPGKDRIILHGGMVRNVLVLSCEAEGDHIKNPDPKIIRKLIKRIKADLDIGTHNNQTQILVGIPAEG